MDNQVAKIILQQIGGHRFVAMTGCHDFINLGNGLRMSLSRNKTSANRVEIIYDEGADLYDLRFYRQSMNHKTFEVKTKDIKTYEGVYCDMLEDIFTDVTGLYNLILTEHLPSRNIEKVGDLVMKLLTLIFPKFRRQRRR